MADKNMKAKINVEFEEAASRQQINSGEDITTLFGKLRKFLADLKAVAFSGAYSDLSGAPDLSAYAKKADVPNIKVNSAVDADTVGEKSADDFPQIIDFGWNETDTKIAVGKSGKTAIYKCANWTDFPVGGTNGQGTLIAINFGGEGTAGIDSMWLVQLYIAAVNGIIYKRYVSHTILNSWVEMYSGDDKPYISGSATVAANNTTCTSNHGFTPSAVIWWDGNDSGVATWFNETQFAIKITSSVDRTINYLIFK